MLFPKNIYKHEISDFHIKVIFPSLIHGHNGADAD